MSGMTKSAARVVVSVAVYVRPRERRPALDRPVRIGA